MSATPIVRVIRVIEYTGPEDWVTETLKRSYATPGTGVTVGADRTIRQIACSAPEIVAVTITNAGAR